MRRFPSSLPRLLSELVACPSVTREALPDGPGEADMADLCAGLLRALGADVRRTLLAPGRPNVIGVWEPPGKAEATILLAPHLDTVGVAGMTVPPFRLTAKAGRLHGRGACDTKGPTAALLWALQRWTRRPARARGNIRWVFAATSAEEEGSRGATSLIEQHVVRASETRGQGLPIDFAVALEPTDLRVVHAAKGILRLWIDTRGRAAHGARPELGQNAIYRMLPVASALERDVAPALAAKRHPLLGPATLNLSLINGGSGINVVPDRCRIGVDIRVHPGCPASFVLQRVRAACDSPSPRAAITIHNDFPSFETPRTNPWAAALRRSARGWAAVPWFCDANVFSAAGIPSAAFGPGSIAQAHTRDEYILARELEAGAAAFERFLSAAKAGP